MSRSAIATLALALATASAGVAFANFIFTSWVVETIEHYLGKRKP
ncbi:hypothetical protein C8K38_111223 [Rhodococcus sp. OK611]|nr:MULTISPECIES: hypothetical protein [unclassified Rhodococcus (in: high G+C Gram-positive bacteria)]PTR42054.1 hypothetical protein C8K38_111223 [Rhodococcus sp. OK611]SNX91499.1 hypothetical protein SAMN05447004_11034 [Rhodococcus sp. OK270]